MSNTEEIELYFPNKSIIVAHTPQKYYSEFTDIDITWLFKHKEIERLIKEIHGEKLNGCHLSTLGEVINKKLCERCILARSDPKVLAKAREYAFKVTHGRYSVTPYTGIYKFPKTHASYFYIYTNPDDCYDKQIKMNEKQYLKDRVEQLEKENDMLKSKLDKNFH